MDVWVQQRRAARPLRLTRDRGRRSRALLLPRRGPHRFPVGAGRRRIYVGPASLGGTSDGSPAAEMAALLAGRLTIAYVGNYWVRASQRHSREAAAARRWPLARRSRGGGPVWSPDSTGLLMLGPLMNVSDGTDHDWWLVSTDAEADGPASGPAGRTRRPLPRSPLSNALPWLVGPPPGVHGHRRRRRRRRRLGLRPRGRRPGSRGAPSAAERDGTGILSHPALDPDGRLRPPATSSTVNLWDSLLWTRRGTGAGSLARPHPRPPSRRPSRRVRGRPDPPSSPWRRARACSGSWTCAPASRPTFPRRGAISGTRTCFPTVRESSTRPGHRGLRRRALFAAPSAGGTPEKICGGCGEPTDWSRDGRRILVQMSDNVIGLADLDAGAAARPLLERGRHHLDRAHFVLMSRRWWCTPISRAIAPRTSCFPSGRARPRRSRNGSQ